MANELAYAFLAAALYEGGIRIPFFVRGPGVARVGTDRQQPVMGADLFPTILEYAGLPLPRGRPIDGVSLWPLLSGNRTLCRDSLFWHFPAYLESVQFADGARDPFFRTRPVGAIRCGQWKLLEYFEDGDLELYNLRKDVGESQNLVSSCPEEAERLYKKLKAWRASVGAPVPDEPNPEYVES